MGRLFVLVGVPGSGKSSYARRKLRRAVRVCPDDVRKMMSGVDYDKRFEPMVWQAAWAMLDTLLPRAATDEFDVVFDATNVTRERRAEVIHRALTHAVDPVCVYFETPLQLAYERNAGRARVVPDDVLFRFQDQLEPPSLDEGFVELIVVHPS